MPLTGGAAVVVLQAEVRRHRRAQALGQVGGPGVEGVHAVLRGHAVAGQAAVGGGHLLQTENTNT